MYSLHRCSDDTRWVCGETSLDRYSPSVTVQYILYGVSERMYPYINIIIRLRDSSTLGGLFRRKFVSTHMYIVEKFAEVHHNGT